MKDRKEEAVNIVKKILDNHKECHVLNVSDVNECDLNYVINLIEELWRERGRLLHDITIIKNIFKQHKGE